MANFRTPFLTVDLIIEMNGGVVLIARARGGELRGRDDARRAGVFEREAFPSPLAFDHGKILGDYFEGRY